MTLKLKIVLLTFGLLCGSVLINEFLKKHRRPEWVARAPKEPLTERRATTKPPEKKGQFVLTMNAVCGNSRAEAARVVLALGQSPPDLEAAQGMIDRGKAMLLSKGTRVESAGSLDAAAAGFSFIFIRAGYHTGRNCWIWNGALE